MAALKLGRDLCKDGSGFQRFITEFRSAASDLDRSNNVVGILKSLTTKIPDITLEMGDIVIHLHIRYEDSYLLGFKVNEGDWYEGYWYSLRKKEDSFHFDVAEKPIGFGVRYGDLGYSFDNSLQTIDLGYHSLRKAMGRMRRFSENPDSVVFKQRQESVAIFILSVCEAARFHGVQQEIQSSFMGTVKLSAASVVDIKNWTDLHQPYYENQAGYTGDLRLVKRRLLTSGQSETSQAGPSSSKHKTSKKQGKKH